MTTYNVQCLCGYVGEAPAGSELEERCRERAAEGFLSALVLRSSECPQCQADREEEARRDQADFRGADMDFFDFFKA